MRDRIQPRVLSQATATELEILDLVKGVGAGIAHEAVDWGWSLATLAAVAYQRGLLEGIAGERRRVEESQRPESEVFERALAARKGK